MKRIENKYFDIERALYGSEDLIIDNCIFAGNSDGESALKECKNIELNNSYLSLRYPLWHNDILKINNCTMNDSCRAALWYTNKLNINKTKMYGIKALRECKDIIIKDSDIISPEFAWFCENIKIIDTKANSEYFMLRTKNIACKNMDFKGKYSFQYIENALFENCNFDTKDAFWHGKDITVKDSIIKGEYLGWYSSNLTLINCDIIGTQPLCYCDNLKLIDCRTFKADLAFEKSDVEANILNEIISIKNPKSGLIKVKEVSEIIMDDKSAKGKVIVQ